MFDASFLSDKLEDLRIKYNVAGMSVAVTDENKLFYNRGFGYENALRPDVLTHSDAMYKIASMTKTVTSVMVLRLCEEGILSLDKPIKHFLPWLKLSRPEAVEVITLRDLLTHIAGMPPDIYLEEGSRDEATIEAVIKSTLPSFDIPALPVDRKYCYSSWGYNVIGLVASVVTGKPLSNIVSEYVLKPLCMDVTTFDYQVASTYPLSLPHGVDSSGKPCVQHNQRVNTVYYAGAGLYSNTSDMCKFARFLLRGGVTDTKDRILNEKSFKDMIFKHIEKPGVYGEYYGLGIFVRPYSNRYIYGHTGNYDPYNSSLFIDPKTKCGVVFMANSNAVDLRYIIPEMIFSLIEQN